MSQAHIDAPALSFSAHCQVRYVERFLDKEAVRNARRQFVTDQLILESLLAEYGEELRRFRHVVQVAYFHLLHKAGKFVQNTRYRINLGSLAVCVEGNVCLTTVCKRKRSAPRPDPHDDDPKEEHLSSDDEIAA